MTALVDTEQEDLIYTMVQVHLMLSMLIEVVQMKLILSQTRSQWKSFKIGSNVVKFPCLYKDAGSCILSKVKFTKWMISDVCQERIAIVETQSDKSMYNSSCSFIW